MRPSRSVFDMANRSRRHSIVGSDFLLEPLVSPDCPNLIGRKHRTAMRFAPGDFGRYSRSKPISSQVPASCNFVSRVFGGRPPPQMSRVTASRVIAGMQRMSAIKRYGFDVMQSKAMSSVGTPFPGAGAEHKLPVSVAKRCGPRPTIAVPLARNFAVKSLALHLYGRNRDALLRQGGVCG